MKIVQAIVGIVLLGSAFFLSYLSNTNGETIAKNKTAIVMKYVKDSQEALENEDIKGAIKFAKSAIMADPKNKAGFKALEDVYETKYKPSQEDMEEESENTQEEESPANEEEEDVDMGC